MAASLNNIQPLSSTGRWEVLIRQYTNEPTRLENIFLNKVPYAVLSRVVDIIQSNWAVWDPLTTSMTKKSFSNAKEFILNISGKDSPYRLQALSSLVRKTYDFAINNVLNECKNLEQQRLQADQDLSKGLMDDIGAETIILLCKAINENAIDWKLLADGLGFDNLACQELDSPFALLDKWLKNNPRATVSRFYFEAGQIKMQAVCDCLDAIPLLGVPAVQANSSSSGDVTIRPITKYDIKRLEELAGEGVFEWDQIAKEVADIDYHRFKKKIDAKDILWQGVSNGNDIRLTMLLNRNSLREYKEIFQVFKSELSDGLFEPTSPGGVTYSQASYLSNIQKKKSITKDPASSYEQFRIPGIPASSHIYRSLTTSLTPDELSKSFKKAMPNFEGESLSIREWILQYWQSPEGEVLDLNAFYNSLKKIIENNSFVGIKNSSFLGQEECLKELNQLYQDIRPLRTYDPYLASINNKKKEQLLAAEKVKDVSQEAIKQVNKKDEQRDSDLCKICLEKEINAVVLPCAHLAFCLSCLKDIKLCGICRTPIDKSIQVFKS